MTTLKRIVGLDAAANLASALVLLVGASFWAAAFGLEARWPIFAMAALFAVNGVECWLTARRSPMPAGSLALLGGFDLAFAVFAIAVAALAPGAEAWARSALAALGGVCVLVGALKLAGALRGRTAGRGVAAAR